MKKFLSFTAILVSAVLSLAQNNSSDWLYMISWDEDYSQAGYINADGDTIIPIGKYGYCFNDTIKDFGVVYDVKRSSFIGINTKDEFMFEVFTFDNGPDYIEDGTFRIKEGNLIGYANGKGEVVIPPKYEAAWPFEDGKAKVSFKAKKEQHDEHWHWVDAEWFYIDKEGNRILE